MADSLFKLIPHAGAVHDTVIRVADPYPGQAVWWQQPLLQTLLGAVLAAGGGYLAGWVAQRRIDGRNRELLVTRAGHMLLGAIVYAQGTADQGDAEPIPDGWMVDIKTQVDRYASVSEHWVLISDHVLGSHIEITALGFRNTADTILVVNRAIAETRAQGGRVLPEAIENHQLLLRVVMGWEEHAIALLKQMVRIKELGERARDMVRGLLGQAENSQLRRRTGQGSTLNDAEARLRRDLPPAS